MNDFDQVSATKILSTIFYQHAQKDIFTYYIVPQRLVRWTHVNLNDFAQNGAPTGRNKLSKTVKYIQFFCLPILVRCVCVCAKTHLIYVKYTRQF